MFLVFLFSILLDHFLYIYFDLSAFPCIFSGSGRYFCLRNSAN